jgi:acetoin utilization deacetylase AcuC-like enzyme
VVDVPLPAGAGDETFGRAWVEVILPAAEAFRPDALLVSAGYDAHRDDPLAALEVTEAGFGEVARAVGEMAARLGIAGVALALEGGYDLDALRASSAATVTGLLAGLGRAPDGNPGE